MLKNSYHKDMTTEGSPGPGPEQQAAVQGTLARISALHKAPNLEVEELLGQFEQLDLLGVTGHPAIAAALRVEGQIPEVANRVRSDLETERFQRLGVLLGVEEPPVVVPEAEDGEMAGLREEAKGLADQAIQRGLTPREVYERFVPVENLSMLSLSQLKERAESLTSEQLSQIPPYKLIRMIDDGLLTVRQVANLPKDQEADRLNEHYAGEKASLEQDLIDRNISIQYLPRMTVAALRVLYGVEAQRLPNDLDDRINPDLVLQSLNNLERQWQNYKRRTGKFLVGGLAKIRTSAPVLSQDQIVQIRRTMDVASIAKSLYKVWTNDSTLSSFEDDLVRKGKLELSPDEMEWMKGMVASAPGTSPLLEKYVRKLRETEAAKATHQADVVESEKPSLENLFAQYRQVWQVLRDSNLPFGVRQDNRQFLSSLEKQIADAIGLEILGIVLDTPRSEEAARQLHGIEYDLVYAILKLPDEGIESKLFSHSSSLQASCRKVRDTYRALSHYFTTVDEHKQARDRLSQAWEGFLAEISSQKGVDRYGTEQRLDAEYVNSEQEFVSLLKDAASTEELSGAFRKWKRVAHHVSGGKVDIYKASISVLLNVLQRAGVNLEPALSEKIEALNKFGIQLEPAGEPEVEKRVVEVSPIDLLRAGYSPVVGELREMLEGITSEQAASLVRSYPWTALEFNESLSATPEVRGTIIRWLMGLTPDRIEPYLRQNPLSVLNMAGWMLERHDLQPVTRNMITDTIAYLSPDTIAGELNKKPMAVFDMKAETAFGPYLTVPSANRIKTHMGSITPDQAKRYFEANPKAILSFDAGMLPYYTPEVQAVIKEEAGKITYVRT